MQVYFIDLKNDNETNTDKDKDKPTSNKTTTTPPAATNKSLNTSGNSTVSRPPSQVKQQQQPLERKLSSSNNNKVAILVSKREFIHSFIFDYKLKYLCRQLKILKRILKKRNLQTLISRKSEQFQTLIRKKKQREVVQLKFNKIFLVLICVMFVLNRWTIAMF